jgi:tRNA(His) 5'-end guanylyltransferase
MKDLLGDRMKLYEANADHRLVRRVPVIIRIDGKAFHTFTKYFDKPFDELFMKAMHETTKALCEQIQCCKLGYTQSDEISLLLTDYETVQTQPWFDNRIEKMCSIAASMATLAFNRTFEKLVESASTTHAAEKTAIYRNAVRRGGLFDARVYNVPKDDVTNYFLWRQNDATRNSILGVGQSQFSHKALQNKSCNEIQDMLFMERSINWNDYGTKYKRGVCVVRMEKEVNGAVRHVWTVDENIPIFKGEGREYVERFVFPNNDENERK